MQKNILLVGFVAVVVVVGIYFLMTNDATTEDRATVSGTITSQSLAPAAGSPDAPAPLQTAPETATPVPATSVGADKAREFTMTAYYDEKGKWYSLKEMSVKKGDTVRVSITNVKGTHTFNIYELGIQKDLPLNKKVVVEFIADKVGDFVYYCSMPGHRSLGQWGTLHVTE